MTRKKYYKLIQDYNDIIEKKHFNSTYCNQSDLDNITVKLLCIIKQYKTMVNSELISRSHSLYDTNNLQRLIRKYDITIQLINEEKVIPEDIYTYTYSYKYMTIYNIPLHLYVCILIILLIFIASYLLR